MKKVLSFSWPTVSWLAVLAIAGVALAVAPLELDDGFDGDGSAHYPIGTRAEAADIAFAANGQVLIGGTVTIGGQRDAAIVRVMHDGDLDGAFGDAGIALLDTGAEERVEAIAVDGDGRIVAVGTRGSRALIARFQPDGDPDPAFGGGDGWRSWRLGTKTTAALDLAALGGGKIVIVGRVGGSTQRAFVARLGVDGADDTTFGAGDGATLATFGLPQARFEAVAIDDGRIVAAGRAWSSQESDAAVARFRSDGAFDGRFGGGDGRVRVDALRQDLALGVAVTASGKVVAVGSTAKAGRDADALIVRLLGSGRPDHTFDGDGLRPVAVSTKADAFTDVVLEGDGGIAMAGFRGGDVLVASSTPTGAFVRYRWVDHIGELDRGAAILRLGSGKLYVGATVTTVAPAPLHEAVQFGLARFFPG